MSSDKTKRIDIVFNNMLGEGTLTCKGLLTLSSGNKTDRVFRCLGQAHCHYPREMMVDPSQPLVKQNPHYSNAYTCPPNNNRAGQCVMRYAILIWGQQGVYIHEWPGIATYAGNGNQGTHGCIHLAQGDAAQVYNWVDTKTYITIKRPW
jgi:hypothetical protein